MDDWAGFAGAVTGASAALLGLLVVALSINLRQIVQSAGLPRRALIALLMLVVPLVAGVLLLVPQSSPAYGIEILVLGVLLGAWIVFLAGPTARPVGQTFGAWLAGTAAPVGIVVVAILVTGVLLTVGHPAGLYGLPVVVLAGFIGSLIGTWVLLVEILR
ncbi:MAG: hypothetical protein ABS81_10560 [Pseudonocardia sp. SCN 72-86]|nr:MAG: hypothetical protein ABS81_10560 [Pseudonocardia sp. SCN 72-86]